MAALPDDLVQEILLRLPPDEPACLLRASLISKPWRRRISHPDFLRRLCKIHRTPPLMGFFHNLPGSPHFTHTTASAFSIAVPNNKGIWSVIDCRHGRVLLLSHAYRGYELLVWEPITGHQRSMAFPPEFKSGGNFTAAVVCAVDGCDHRDCTGGTFRVVSVFSLDLGIEDSVTSACEYSSETGAWGELSSIGQFSFWSVKPSLLVRNSLLYFSCGFGYILEYDLAGRKLVAVGLPQLDILAAEEDACQTKILLMSADNDGLGVAEVEGSFLYLWTRDVSTDGDAQWIQSRAINLHNLLPVAALSASRKLNLIGYAKEENTIFLCTNAGVFTLELKSERVKKVYEEKTGGLDFVQTRSFEALFPFSSFYIPGKQVAAPGGDMGTGSYPFVRN